MQARPCGSPYKLIIRSLGPCARCAVGTSNARPPGSFRAPGHPPTHRGVFVYGDDDSQYGKGQKPQAAEEGEEAEVGGGAVFHIEPEKQGIVEGIYLAGGIISTSLN